MAYRPGQRIMVLINVLGAWVPGTVTELCGPSVRGGTCWFVESDPFPGYDRLIKHGRLEMRPM